jgi:hypothetical protein
VAIRPNEGYIEMADLQTGYYCEMTAAAEMKREAVMKKQSPRLKLFMKRS